MAIYKSSNMSPQLREVDLNDNNTFTAQVNTSGESVQAYKMQILSGKGDDIIYDPKNPTLLPKPVKNTKMLEIENVNYSLHDEDKSFENGKDYQWGVRVYNLRPGSEEQPNTLVCDGFEVGSTKSVVWSRIEKNNKLRELLEEYNSTPAGLRKDIEIFFAEYSLETRKAIYKAYYSASGEYIVLNDEKLKELADHDRNLVLDQVVYDRYIEFNVDSKDKLMIGAKDLDEKTYPTQYPYRQRKKIDWVDKDLGTDEDIMKIETTEAFDYNYIDETPYSIYQCSDEHTVNSFFSDPNGGINVSDYVVIYYNLEDALEARKEGDNPGKETLAVEPAFSARKITGYSIDTGEVRVYESFDYAPTNGMAYRIFSYDPTTKTYTETNSTLKHFVIGPDTNYYNKRGIVEDESEFYENPDLTSRFGVFKDANKYTVSYDLNNPGVMEICKSNLINESTQEDPGSGYRYVVSNGDYYKDKSRLDSSTKVGTIDREYEYTYINDNVSSIKVNELVAKEGTNTEQETKHDWMQTISKIDKYCKYVDFFGNKLSGIEWPTVGNYSYEDFLGDCNWLCMKYPSVTQKKDYNGNCFPYLYKNPNDKNSYGHLFAKFVTSDDSNSSWSYFNRETVIDANTEAALKNRTKPSDADRWSVYKTTDRGNVKYWAYVDGQYFKNAEYLESNIGDWYWKLISKTKESTTSDSDDKEQDIYEEHIYYIHTPNTCPLKKNNVSTQTVFYAMPFEKGKVPNYTNYYKDSRMKEKAGTVGYIFNMIDENVSKTTVNNLPYYIKTPKKGYIQDGTTLYSDKNLTKIAGVIGAQYVYYTTEYCTITANNTSYYIKTPKSGKVQKGTPSYSDVDLVTINGIYGADYTVVDSTKSRIRVKSSTYFVKNSDLMNAKSNHTGLQIYNAFSGSSAQYYSSQDELFKTDGISSGNFSNIYSQINNFWFNTNANGLDYITFTMKNTTDKYGNITKNTENSDGNANWWSSMFNGWGNNNDPNTTKGQEYYLNVPNSPLPAQYGFVVEKGTPYYSEKELKNRVGIVTDSDLTYAIGNSQYSTIQIGGNTRYIRTPLTGEVPAGTKFYLDAGFTQEAGQVYDYVNATYKFEGYQYSTVGNNYIPTPLYGYCPDNTEFYSDATFKTKVGKVVVGEKEVNGTSRILMYQLEDGGQGAISSKVLKLNDINNGSEATLYYIATPTKAIIPPETIDYDCQYYYKTDKVKSLFFSFL